MKNLKNINLFVILATASVNLMGAGEAAASEGASGHTQAIEIYHSNSPRSVANYYKEEQSAQDVNKKVTSEPAVSTTGWFDKKGRFNTGSKTASVSLNEDANTAETNNTQEGGVRMSNVFNEDGTLIQDRPPVQADSNTQNQSIKERFVNRKRINGTVSADGIFTVDSNAGSAVKSTASSQPKGRVITGYFDAEGNFTDGSELGLPLLDSRNQ